MSPGSPQSLVVDPQGTTPTSFFAHDAADPRYYVRGRIDPHSDYLLFRIITRILSTGERSAVSPEALFDAMMSHFGQQPGGLPAAIRGIWDHADPEFVTNLDRFNAALAAGNDEATAARATFTGRMATKYGYNTVVMGVTDPPNGPPPYTKANVYFKK